MIPDCYDPVHQEEHRQRSWDYVLSKCPVCALCKRRIYPDESYHYTGRSTVCNACVSDLLDNTDTVEVDV